MEMTGAVIPAPEDRSGNDDPELLGVGGAGGAGRERFGHGRRDADARLGVLGFEDVREVAGRGDPGRDDRLGGGELVGAPGEVLTDHVAVARARYVARRADAVDGGLAAGRDVR